MNMLGAHRTFKMDVRGDCETFMLITTFKAHEGFWKLNRVGSLDDKRCVIQITNNRCVKDKINHLGWSLELPERGVSARGWNDANWFVQNKRPKRDDNSVYCLLSKATEDQIQGNQMMRVWEIEIVKSTEFM